MIMPAEVKATGPKGFLLKSDVLEFIETNKLVKGQRKPVAAAAAAPTEKKAKKPAAAKKEAKASPAYDPNDPFQQTWKDQGLKDGFSQIAQNIKH